MCKTKGGLLEWYTDSSTLGQKAQSWGRVYKEACEGAMTIVSYIEHNELLIFNMNVP